MSPTSAPAESDAAPDSAFLELHRVRTAGGFPDGMGPEDVARFLHRTLQPYEDSPEDIRRGLNDALEAEGGFCLLALREPPSPAETAELVGALVMLPTGMKGYVPENLLLYVAVDPERRGEGIGARICEAAVRAVQGRVKLHVDHDNPARHLYERLGFESKYLEMRLDT